MINFLEGFEWGLLCVLQHSRYMCNLNTNHPALSVTAAKDRLRNIKEGRDSQLCFCSAVGSLGAVRGSFCRFYLKRNQASGPPEACVSAGTAAQGWQGESSWAGILPALWRSKRQPSSSSDPPQPARSWGWCLGVLVLIVSFLSSQINTAGIVLEVGQGMNGAAGFQNWL